MQVCYKKTDFLGDQVLLTAFAPGGLTEVDEADFKTYSMANTLAQELGPFGFKPEVPSLTYCPSIIHSSLCSFFHSLTHSLIPSFTCSLARLFVCLFVCLFVRSFVHPLIHAPIY